MAHISPTASDLFLAGLPQWGKFKLAARLASGGMAEVFVAVQSGIGGVNKVVALKRMLPTLSDRPEFVQMFINEARHAALLEHPNIVRISELGDVEGVLYIAMEYLAGEDLSRILRWAKKRGQPAPLEMVASLVQQAADGLHYAHGLTDGDGKRLGLVHRDISPSNVIVTFQGITKVVDFGIARATAQVSHTQTGMVRGKLAYMAPELLEGATPSRASDVFGLGATLWEALSGQPLFLKDNEAATLKAVERTEVPPLSQLRKDAPASLDAICQKALERNPGRRFQSAAELSEALEGQLQKLPSGRPSQRQVAQWLTQLFGEPWVEAKLSISKGSRLRESLGAVLQPSAIAPKAPAGAKAGNAQRELLEPNALPTAPMPMKTGAVVAASFAAFTLGLCALTPALLPNANPPASKSFEVPLETAPAGAAILIDGEPTGFVTPATLGRFSSGPVTFTFFRPGFAPAERSWSPSDPPPAAVTLEPKTP